MLAKLVELYKEVPGLKQKYFVADPKTGEERWHVHIRKPRSARGILKVGCVEERYAANYKGRAEG
jgi:hypothetical protein